MAGFSGRGVSAGISIDGKTTGYSRALRDAARETKRFERDATRELGKWRDNTKRAFRAAATGMAVVGVAAVGAGVKMISLAADAAEVDSKLQVVFGKNLPKVSKELNSFAKATGASRYALRQQAADMGALLKPMGLMPAQANKMSVSMVKLATDLSSFNNVPVDEALTALRSGLVGETEPLRRFGVIMSADAVAAEAFRMGLVKVAADSPKVIAAQVGVEKATQKATEAQKQHGLKSLEAREAQAKLGLAQERLNKALAGSGVELSAAQKAQASYSLIMRQTTQAQGDATKTADSMSNLLRRVKNSAKDAATDLGAALLPAARDLTKEFAGFVSGDRFQAWLQRTGASARVFANDLVQTVRSTGFREGMHAAWEATKLFGTAVAETTRFLYDHRAAIAGAIAGYAAWKGITVAAEAVESMKLAVSGLNLALKANPIGMIAAGAGIAVGALTALYLESRRSKVEVVQLKDATKGLTSALFDLQAARDAIRDKKLTLAESRLELQQAKTDYQALVKAYGAGSVEAQQAFLRIQRAKQGVTQATKDVTKAERDEAAARSERQATLKNDFRAWQDNNQVIRETEDRLKSIRGQLKSRVDAGGFPISSRNLGEMRKQAEQLEKQLPQLREAQKKSWRQIESTAGQHGVKMTKLQKDYLQEQTAGLNAALGHQTTRFGTWRSSVVKVAGGASQDVKRESVVMNAALRNVGDVKPNMQVFSSNLTTSLQQAVKDIRQTQFPNITLPVDLVFNMGGPSGSGWPLGAGAAASVDAFTPLAAGFGLQMTSGYRPGDPGYHGINRARDYSNGFGPTPQQMSFAKFMIANFGSRLKELIYTPLGFSIKNGAVVPPYAQADHYDHVHVALQRGGRAGFRVPGIGTGDKIPALLEPREGIVNQRAMDAGGAPIVDWLNSSIPRFAKGTPPTGRANQLIAAATAAESPDMSWLKKHLEAAMKALTSALVRGPKGAISGGVLAQETALESRLKQLRADRDDTKKGSKARKNYDTKIEAAAKQLDEVREREKDLVGSIVSWRGSIKDLRDQQRQEREDGIQRRQESRQSENDARVAERERVNQIKADMVQAEKDRAEADREAARERAAAAQEDARGAVAKRFETTHSANRIAAAQAAITPDSADDQAALAMMRDSALAQFNQLAEQLRLFGRDYSAETQLAIQDQMADSLDAYRGFAEQIQQVQQSYAQTWAQQLVDPQQRALNQQAAIAAGTADTADDLQVAEARLAVARQQLEALTYQLANEASGYTQDTIDALTDQQTEVINTINGLQEQIDNAREAREQAAAADRQQRLGEAAAWVDSIHKMEDAAHELALAQAETTADRGDDIAALTAQMQTSQKKAEELAWQIATYGQDYDEATKVALMEQQAAAIRAAHALGDRIAELQKPVEQTADNTGNATDAAQDLALALAEATETREDDIAALTAMLQTAQSRVASLGEQLAAVAAGDEAKRISLQEQQAAAIRQVISLGGRIAELQKPIEANTGAVDSNTGATEDNTQAQQESLEQSMRDLQASMETLAGFMKESFFSERGNVFQPLAHTIVNKFSQSPNADHWIEAMRYKAQVA